MTVILTNINTIIGIIASLVGIIVAIMAIKWDMIFPLFKLKKRLKKYKKIRTDEEKERKKAKQIVSLLLKARSKFENKDFNYSINNTNDGDVSVRGLYKIHLTPPRGIHHQQFKISRVNDPTEAYYSEGYPEAQRINNNIMALDNLIKII